METIASLSARLDAYLLRGDPRPLLSPDAVSEAERLHEETVRDGLLPGGVVELLGWLHWCRYQAGSGADRSAALRHFALLVPRHPDLLPDSLSRPLYGLSTDAAPDDLADLAGLVLDRLRDGMDADRAATLLRRAIADSGPGHPRRAAHHSELCRALCMYYDELGDAEDIDAAVEAGRIAVADEPLPAHLFNLGYALSARYRERDALDDLDGSVAAFRAGAEAAGPADPDRAALLHSLAVELVERFHRLDRSADLDEAIAIARAESHPELAEWLQARFQRFGRMADLDAAVSAGRPPDALLLRFERLGDRADIDEAVAGLRAAVSAAPRWRQVAEGTMTVIGEAPEAAMTALNGLCNALRRRYERFGELADLDEAIDLGRGLLHATPAADGNRAVYAMNLGLSLALRFSATGGPADVDAGAAALRDALAAVPADHPFRLTIQINLIDVLRERFEAFADPADLDEAVGIGRAALAAVDGGHPLRVGLLMHLGTALLVRHERAGDPADLDGALAAARAAVGLLPADHPARAGALGNLGHALRTVYDTRGDRAALREARTLWQAAAHAETAPSAGRLEAFRSYADAAAEAGDWPAACEAGGRAVEQLCVAAWRGLGRASRERRLAAGAGTGADAAASAIAAGDPPRGVELLEQGRGVLWTDVLDARADLALLAARAPGLAARLTAVRCALDGAATVG